MFSDTSFAKVLMEVAFLCGVVAASASCSVLEDRSDCPCFLTLDFSGVETSQLMAMGLDSLNVRISDMADFRVTEGWGLSDNVRECCIPVPKTVIGMNVLCADGSFVNTDSGSFIPEGMQCPIVYMDAELVDADAGELKRTVALHKNWCRLETYLRTADYGIQRPYCVALYGNVCGYGYAGELLVGDFHCVSDAAVAGTCSVRIPRQMDDSLWLQVRFLDTGEIHGFPVGEFISQSRYDWSAADLEDVKVDVDFTKSGVTFSISAWKKTLYFDMTI